MTMKHLCESVLVQQCDEDGEVSSWMKDHSDKIHEGHEDEETDYKFTVITSHRYDLTKQSEEVIRIKIGLEKGPFTDHY